MLPVLDHMALFIGAGMIGHQLLACVETHSEWVRLEGQALIGILDGHRIVAGLEADPARRMDQPGSPALSVKALAYLRSRQDGREIRCSRSYLQQGAEACLDDRASTVCS